MDQDAAHLEPATLFSHEPSHAPMSSVHSALADVCPIKMEVIETNCL